MGRYLVTVVCPDRELAEAIAVHVSDRHRTRIHGVIVQPEPATLTPDPGDHYVREDDPRIVRRLMAVRSGDL